MQTSIKTCFKCGQGKPLDEFYCHSGMGDGYLGKCKECTRKDVQKNREANIDYYRAYDRARGNRMTAEDIRKQRARHPEWARAHRAVSKAKIRKGLKPLPCEICGTTEHIHAHHDDYSKPLEIRWLCALHHKQVHKEMRAQ